MLDDEGSHELIDAGDVVEPLKAEPEGLGSGLAVTFAAKESAEFGCQSHGFMQGWRITGHDRFSCRTHKFIECLAIQVCKFIPQAHTAILGSGQSWSYWRCTLHPNHSPPVAPPLPAQPQRGFCRPQASHQSQTGQLFECDNHPQG